MNMILQLYNCQAFKLEIFGESSIKCPWLWFNGISGSESLTIFPNVKNWNYKMGMPCEINESVT